jgi:acyl carrier protein
MCDQESRLIRCFAAVFPGLEAEELRRVSAQSNEYWDSLAGVTLAAVVQQEFGVDIDVSTLAELDSFSAFHTYLSGQVSRSGS